MRNPFVGKAGATLGNHSMQGRGNCMLLLIGLSPHCAGSEADQQVSRQSSGMTGLIASDGDDGAVVSAPLQRNWL